MAELLYIEASPFKGRSNSIVAAETFLDSYRKHNPQDTLTKIDIWNTELPPFDATTIEAKFAVLRGAAFTPQQQEKWTAVRAVAQHFNRADKYVFSVPMWNFSIPYRFKHYIDVVTLAGENWSWSKAGGYRGLLQNKKALLIYSSAGNYPIEMPAADDFQKPYLRRWLRFIGVTAIDEITVAPTLADADALAATQQKALSNLTELSANF